VRVTSVRANAITLVATSQEVSALVSGARMARAAMDADPDAPPAARRLSTLLGRVLADYDAALSRTRRGDVTCTSSSSSSDGPT
jgi:hypothetical protein